MNEHELARAVAREIGSDTSIETERVLQGGAAEAARGLGVTETLAAASFLVSCARLALDIWRARRDRALLVEELLEKAPYFQALESEKRLSLIGRLVDRLVPESLDAYPSLNVQATRSKKEWLSQWLGLGSRAFSPTVLMPFADMDNYIVYAPISWSPHPTAVHLPSVTVPRGFVTDLATIPAYFWWALPPTGKHGHAAILHDWLYWDQQSSREIADKIFDEAMKELAISLPLRKALWGAVRVFGASYWSDAGAERRNGGSRLLKKFPESSTVSWQEWRRQPNVFA